MAKKEEKNKKGKSRKKAEESDDDMATAGAPNMKRCSFRKPKQLKP
jgi:hypothetical protein